MVISLCLVFFLNFLVMVWIGVVKLVVMVICILLVLVVRDMVLVRRVSNSWGRWVVMECFCGGE